jgi:hypothetical protein
MRRALPAASFVLLCLLTLSCGKNDDSVESTPGVPNVILPLQVGYSWTYQRISFDTQGTIVGMDTLVERVGRDTLIQGERWYIWATTSGFSMGTLRGDGYWSYVGGVPALTLRYPASLHDMYLLSDTGPTMRVLALDTLIAVPVGTFPCSAYEQLSFRDGARIRIDYYAANTGLVRAEEYVRAPSGGDSLAHRSDLIGLHLY